MVPDPQPLEGAGRRGRRGQGRTPWDAMNSDAARWREGQGDGCAARGGAAPAMNSCSNKRKVVFILSGSFGSIPAQGGASSLTKKKKADGRTECLPCHLMCLRTPIWMRRACLDLSRRAISPNAVSRHDRKLVEPQIGEPHKVRTQSHSWDRMNLPRAVSDHAPVGQCTKQWDKSHGNDE